jgi:outer membrane usher protein
MRRTALATALAAALGAPTAASGAERLASLRLDRSLLQARAPLLVPGTPATVTGAGDLTEVYVDLVINGERRGEAILRLGAGGALWLERGELASRNLDSGGATATRSGGTELVDVRTIPGSKAAFDERKLVLELALPPEAFERRVIDLRPGGRPDAIRTRDTSAYANYRIEHFQAEGTKPGLVLSHEIGARIGDWLVRTEGLTQRREGATRTTRYVTQAIHDERDETRRWIVGDSTATSGDLGSTFPMGGLALVKAYQLNPYITPQAMAMFSGMVATPSDLEIFLGNTPVARQRLSPGPFDLRNLSYFGGQRDLRVVVRDAFGRVQAIEFPFYFTERSLARGLHEYGYFAGRVREPPGDSGGAYLRHAGAFFHRYGFTDSVTGGMRGEASGGRGNAGGELALRLDRAGVLTMGASASRDRGARTTGVASSASYLFQREPWNARLLWRGAQDRYVLADIAANAALPRRELSAGAGYANPRWGSLDLGLSRFEGRDGRELRATTVSYSKSFGSRWNLIATWRHSRGDIAPGHEVFLGVFYNPQPEASASLTHTRVGGIDTTALQYAKSVDPGEGLGYRLSLERSAGAGEAVTRVTPFLQYNAPYGTLIAEARRETPGGGLTRRVAAQGAVTWVGGQAGLSRPVYDSFAQVRVEPPLAGVRVYQNHREIGRTPENGTLFVPNLGSFLDNVISIDHRDVPIEYSIATTERVISPPFRSGSLVLFPLKRMQGVAGRLVRMGVEGRVEPLTHYQARITVAGVERAFALGSDGGFYLEDIPPGRHDGSALGAGPPCRFALEVPESKDPIVELPKAITCEAN